MNNRFGFGRLMSRARHFLRDKSGNFSMITAIMLIPLAGMSGAALDYSVALSARSKLQQTCDFASLAATKALSKDPSISDAKLQTIVNKVFSSVDNNLVFAKDVSALFKRVGKGVRVEAKSTVDTNVISVLGIEEIDVAVFSESAPSVFKKIELALVLDNTGSMATNSRMTALKDASKLLIDTLIPAGAHEDNVKISIVPYDITVNIGSSYGNESWLDESNGSQSNKKNKWNSYQYGNTWCGLVKPANTDYKPVVSPSSIEAYYEPCIPLPEIQTLTTSAVTLKNKINTMVPNGWTYIPSGLMWGWRTLDPRTPFTQGAKYKDEKWQKIIVLMTDGVNTSKWSNGKLFTNIQPGAGDAKTKNLCKKIKKKDIRIFTIAFDLNSSSTEKLLRKCATDPSDFFATHSPEGLKAAFSAIAGNINRMRLIR